MGTGAGRPEDQREERKVSVAGEVGGEGQGQAHRDLEGGLCQAEEAREAVWCEIKDQSRVPAGEIESSAFQTHLEGTWE